MQRISFRLEISRRRKLQWMLAVHWSQVKVKHSSTLIFVSDEGFTISLGLTHGRLCHFHGSEALVSLARLCPCQQCIFTQGFLYSPQQRAWQWHSHLESSEPVGCCYSQHHKDTQLFFIKVFERERQQVFEVKMVPHPVCYQYRQPSNRRFYKQ